LFKQTIEKIIAAQTIINEYSNTKALNSNIIFFHPNFFEVF
ncbi:hypothetical protein LCGC14_1360280, partial [marine sediment metagenome]